jgi:hypothetical protein
MTGPGQGLDMDPDLAEPSMRGLGTAGTALESAWTQLESDVVAGEAGIGTDRLGWAFREGIGGGRAGTDFGTGYIGPADVARRGARELPGQYQELSAAGLASAQDYRDADRRGAAAMPG